MELAMSLWMSKSLIDLQPGEEDCLLHRVKSIYLFCAFAANDEMLVTTHFSFPSVGRVAIDGDAFRFVPACWDY